MTDGFVCFGFSVIRSIFFSVISYVIPQAIHYVTGIQWNSINVKTIKCPYDLRVSAVLKTIFSGVHTTRINSTDICFIDSLRLCLTVIETNASSNVRIVQVVKALKANQ